MPGLRVRVEELGYVDKTVASTVAATVTELLWSLSTIRDNDDSAEVIANPEMAEAPSSETGGPDGAINMTILRVLWMISFRFASYRLIQQEDRTTLSREDTLIPNIIRAITISYLSRLYWHIIEK
jgi:hypothetical protein